MEKRAVVIFREAGKKVFVFVLQTPPQPPHPPTTQQWGTAVVGPGELPQPRGSAVGSFPAGTAQRCCSTALLPWQ